VVLAGGEYFFAASVGPSDDAATCAAAAASAIVSKECLANFSVFIIIPDNGAIVFSLFTWT
jgi:hypothetical protein